MHRKLDMVIMLGVFAVAASVPIPHKQTGAANPERDLHGPKHDLHALLPEQAGTNRMSMVHEVRTPSL